MERNRYLQLCQKNAVYPNSAEIEVDGIIYSPVGLLIWFNSKGETQNTAEIIEKSSKSVRHEKIERLKEVEA